ncbi:uncharacterized membrane protein YidH (DUF202 family) [Mucilaginibacter sp. SG564]|nr:uncharacterized membrane protein YidH (DUF202 family) [Mucilaginibacter sp. SG564]
MKTIIDLSTAIIGLTTALIGLFIAFRNINQSRQNHKTMTEKTTLIIAIGAVFAMVIFAICYISKRP